MSLPLMYRHTLSPGQACTRLAPARISYKFGEGAMDMGNQILGLIKPNLASPRHDVSKRNAA